MDYYNKNREGQHIVGQIRSLQEELDARDMIRQFPTQSNNSNPQSSVPWGLITVTMLIVLGGALIVKSISIPASHETVVPQSSVNTLPNLPVAAP